MQTTFTLKEQPRSGSPPSVYFDQRRIMTARGKPLHHNVFFGQDREKIKDAKKVLLTPCVAETVFDA